MKLFLRIVFYLLLPAASMAQNSFYKTVSRGRADSLRNQLKVTGNDTLRMIWSRDLSNYYSEINFDSSLYYGQQVFAIAEKHGFKLWEANGLYTMALSFTRFGNYPKALESYTNAKKIAEDPASEMNIPHIEYFTLNGDPHHARLIVLANVVSDGGSLYGYTGSPEKDVEERFRAIKIAETINDKVTQSITYSNLSLIFLFLGKKDSADLFMRRSELLADEVGFEYYKGYFSSLRGIAAFTRSDFDSAAFYFKEAIENSRKQKTYPAESFSYMWLARVFSKKNQVDSSIFYARKTLLMSRSTISKPDLAGVYRSLANYFFIQNRPDSAYKYLNLSVALNDTSNNEEKENLRKYQSMGFDEQLRMQELEKDRIESRNRNRIYLLFAGLGVFLLVGILLFRNSRQKHKANKKLEATLTDLRLTQTQLIQSEKMASLGELTAGIAHEIQNPLNFVNNFSEVNKELLTEMNEEIAKSNFSVVTSLAKDITENEEKINLHGKRADAIVKGMLQHSRSSSGVKEPTDINALVDEYLRLAYHGMRAKDKLFNASMRMDFDKSIGNIKIIPQDIGRVILNLITNAFYALSVRTSGKTDGYEPTVVVSTKRVGNKVEVSVKDNGDGIPQKLLDKIFQPFFTTKPTGQGTGLGLSLSYDIIKAHGGEIKVNTVENEGTEFIIVLPN